MHPSRRELLKQPGVIPLEAAPTCLLAEAPKRRERRRAIAVFPSRDGRLPDAGNGGHFDLRRVEDASADMFHRVHPFLDIRIWINCPSTSAGSGLVGEYPFVYNFGMDVSAILQAIMVARGWTQEELAHELDAGQSSVSRWMSGGMPGGRILERIRELARGSGIIERGPVASNQVPLMGRVGAGAEVEVEYEQAPADGYDTIELPFSYPDPIIAFEVEGESMLPVYEPKEVIVCLRDQVLATDHYVGRRVVVRIATGERYIKRLARGLGKGTYNLESWNASTIEDVRVEWVGEIVATVPPAMVRRVERHLRRAGQTSKPNKVASKVTK